MYVYGYCNYVHVYMYMYCPIHYKSSRSVTTYDVLLVLQVLSIQHSGDIMVKSLLHGLSIC